MAGLMNNYFYGKAGKGDYTVEQMPTTRKQLFFTTLRVRFSSMMGLNFLHLIFCIPLLIMVYIGFQSMMFYMGDNAYEIGSPDMKAAYQVYSEANTAYAEYRDVENNLKKLTHDLSEVESKISQLNEGKTVTKTLPPVVEGGAEEIVNVTLDECMAEKVSIQAEIARLSELAGKETFAEEKEALRVKLIEAASEYELYRGGEMKSNIAMTLLFMIPLMGIAGIGSTGQMYILRNWARDEHAFLWQDYKNTIKSNWKQGLIVGLINGFSLYICFVGFITYGQMSEANGLIFEIPRWLMVVMLMVWWMINEIIYPMMVTYDMKVTQLIRNSFIMVLARLPMSFIILLGSMLVPALIALLLPMQISMLILILVYGLFGFSLTGFVYASYANSCFDRYLNPRIEGAEVNKGLRNVDDDDDEEEEKPLADAEPKEDRFWERKS